jgi:hypothetical protein
MAHDATKVLMGTTKSSFKDVSNHAGTYVAGTAVRLKSDDTLSVTLADGNLLGVSLGQAMSDISNIAIVRKGLGVPLLCGNGHSPAIGAVVYIDDTNGKSKASGAGATATAAVYASAVLTGVTEAGSTANVVLIDFPGGL